MSLDVEIGTRSAGIERYDYWNALESQYSSAEALIAEQIVPADVAGFVRGCDAALSHVATLNPSVIFVAARGGGVLRWAIEELAEGRSYDLPKIHTLLIGNRTDVDDPRIYTPTKREKTQTIRRDPYLSQEAIDSAVENPVFIDEKSGGKSSRYAATKLHGLLRERIPGYSGPLHLLALEYREPKVDHYAGLFMQSRKSIVPFVVKAPNPFVDRRSFLDAIIDPPGFPKARKYEKAGMLMRMHNVEAEKLIKFLTFAVQNPEALRKSISMLNGSASLNEADHDFRAMYQIVIFVGKLVNQYDQPDEARTFRDTFVDWLQELAANC